MAFEVRHFSPLIQRWRRCPGYFYHHRGRGAQWVGPTLAKTYNNGLGNGGRLKREATDRV
jgi:hypothetical protein